MFQAASSGTGQISRLQDPNTHVTASFDIDGERWLPRRKNIWKQT